MTESENNGAASTRLRDEDVCEYRDDATADGHGDPRGSGGAVVHVRVASISVSSRARKDLGDVSRLAASIEDVGLLHPIILNTGLELIAGGRRLAAVKQLGRETVEARVVRTLDELDRALRAERDENLCRLDLRPSEAVTLAGKLTEFERAAARTRQLSGLRIGDSTAPSRPAKKTERDRGQTRDKVASAVGMSSTTLGKAQEIVAAAAESPEHFRDLVEQMDSGGKVGPVHRELKRRRKRIAMNQRARDVDRATSQAQFKLIEGDCVAVLTTLFKRGKRFRLIFADPPYNEGVDYGLGAEADRLARADYVRWCNDWIRRCADVLADDGSMWCLISEEWADEFGVLLRASGLHRRRWVVWYETFGMNCNDNFNKTARHLLYCVKDPNRFVFNEDVFTRPSARQLKYNDGRARAGGKLFDSVWGVPWIGTGGVVVPGGEIPRLVDNAAERIPDFPTQLPRKLLRLIIAGTSETGDQVLDPFNGSGTTGHESIVQGRVYTGIDRNERYIKLATQRLEAALSEE